jgi:microsomal dipeptidase-like Zn-dependent dipeptidase
MQLTYNNQSLLASGCYEEKDNGLSRMGKEVIEEMNRVGMIIDMSHSGEKSTIEAIEYSKLPITISHANPSFWHNAKRNKSNEILKLLASKGGILGLSLYPHHLKNNSNCTLDSFCKMIVDLIELIGVDHIGFGSDLCQDQPDSVVEWMRVGRWTKKTDYGEGSASNPGFPKMPSWFKGNKDWENILNKLQKLGLKQIEIEKIKGLNWYNFLKKTKAFK